MDFILVITAFAALAGLILPLALTLVMALWDPGHTRASAPPTAPENSRPTRAIGQDRAPQGGPTAGRM